MKNEPILRIDLIRIAEVSAAWQTASMTAKLSEVVAKLNAAAPDTEATHDEIEAFNDAFDTAAGCPPHTFC